MVGGLWAVKIFVDHSMPNRRFTSWHLWRVGRADSLFSHSGWRSTSSNSLI